MRTLLIAVAGIVAMCVIAGCGTAVRSPPLHDGTTAVGAVLAQDARFDGIGPRDPDLIGQAAWYEVAADGDGWLVTVRIGWGDCEAGCISERVWIYAVDAAGDVTLRDEHGDAWPGASGVRGVATSGPTCPVVRDPPDPNCADRPVGGAEIVVFASDGREAARTTTAADGSFELELAPGDYRIVPGPVEGLMGTAAEQDVRVTLGAMSDISLFYDTGIR